MNKNEAYGIIELNHQELTDILKNFKELDAVLIKMKLLRIIGPLTTVANDLF